MAYSVSTAHGGRRLPHRGLTAAQSWESAPDQSVTHPRKVYRPFSKHGSVPSVIGVRVYKSRPYSQLLPSRREDGSFLPHHLSTGIYDVLFL